MRAVLVYVFLCLGISCVHCKLWPKGIVHYNINSKDYDLHSQDAIMAAFRRIEREICVKFFNTPMSYSTNVDNKILFISNPEKLKDCPSKTYDYGKSVVDVAIGYKCINEKDIARIVVDLLRASISPDPFNVDYVKKYQDNKVWIPRDGSSGPLCMELPFFSARSTSVLWYYHTECSNLDLPRAPVGSARRCSKEIKDEERLQMSSANWNFYKKLVWPLGVIMYGVDPSVYNTPEHYLLKFAMSELEGPSGVVFQFVVDKEQVLEPRNFLWFSKDGADEPALGFTKGNQTINIYKMTHGCPRHNAHLLNNLMRALGVPMMSNRHDRDSYVTVNWALVEKGKEYLLERMPEEAWIEQIAYDYTSVTHAPANYMCSNCALGAQSVQPQRVSNTIDQTTEHLKEDHLWQKTMSMGHTSTLSESDAFTLELLYFKEVGNRLAAKGAP